MLDLSPLEDILDSDARRWLPILRLACESGDRVYPFIEEIIPAAWIRGLIKPYIPEEGGVFHPIFRGLERCISSWLRSEESTLPDYRELTEALISLWKHLVVLQHILTVQHHPQLPAYEELPSSCIACDHEGRIGEAIKRRFPDQGLW